MVEDIDNERARKRARCDGDVHPDGSSFQDGELSDDLPPPPPPVPLPPSCTLLIHRSSNPASAASLFPHEKRLIQLPHDSQVLVGRDRSYLPLIRLKSLQVSKVHATIYYEEVSKQWSIVDNASTYGTFVRRPATDETEYTRLSEKGCTSMPRVLQHGDLLKIATQRFVVHIHPRTDCPSSQLETGFCNSCTPHEDGSDVVSLTATPTQHVPSSSAPDPTAPACLAPPIRSKDEKFADHKQNMKSLRASLLSSAPRAVPAPRTSSGTTTPELAETADAVQDVRQPAYIDRAKLRRAMYPAQGSDNTSAISSHPIEARSYAPAAVPAEPAYGAGAKLYDRMLGSRTPSAASAPPLIEAHNGALDQQTSNPSQTDAPHREMGKVIDVRTTFQKGAGLGNAMRMGVEEVGGMDGAGRDWRDSGRERRWKEVFGKPG